MGDPVTRLTSSQREVLVYLAGQDESALGSDIATALGRPPEGLHQTAASLVRRGLATRYRQRWAPGSRPGASRPSGVRYTITDEGRKATR